MEFPYHQPQPLRQYDNIVEIGASGSKLILTQAFANYFQRIQKLATITGFEVNTPAIDLSGQSPGILYALGAKAIGQPWMLGGYPGSDQLAINRLMSIDCKEVAAAWIFFEPKSSRKISPSILDNFGINIRKDFKIAAEFETPLGMGDCDKTINRKQQLLKPTRSIVDATAACEKVRKKSL